MPSAPHESASLNGDTANGAELHPGPALAPGGTLPGPTLPRPTLPRPPGPPVPSPNGTGPIPIPAPPGTEPEPGVVRRAWEWFKGLSVRWKALLAGLATIALVAVYLLAKRRRKPKPKPQPRPEPKPIPDPGPAPDPTAKCCIDCDKDFQAPKNQSKCLEVPFPRVDTKGNPYRILRVGQEFWMSAVFSGKPPCVCGCCQYRQYVRGEFRRNGQRQGFPLPDPNGGSDIELLPRPAPGAADDNFREDGFVNPVPEGSNRWYGHRDEAEPGNSDTTDVYPGGRLVSCQYDGHDFPSMFGVEGSGETYSMDFDFRGVIICSCNGKKVMCTREWTVKCGGKF